MRKRLVEKGLCVCKRELLGLAQELFPRGSVERRPQVDPKLFEYRGFGERRGGARSPLVLSGLVLAGANRQGDEAAPDHGIITAEGLIGLRMEGLELAVYPPARRVSASRAAAKASTASSAPSTSPAARKSSRPCGKWTTPPRRR